MRITIVGCGDVGTALARHWRRQASGEPRELMQLTLTTTREERREGLEALGARVLVLRADDRGALAEALADAEVAVFCLAPGGDRAVDAATYAATYRDSFRTVVDLTPELPRLRQIVYTGSCAVYGDAGGDWVDETTPPDPRDDHGRVLLESESLLQSCRTAERAVCLLRLGAIHGPGRQLLHRFRRLAGTTRPGDGASHCSWIHRDDVVGAIAAAVDQRWDGIVNVVDDAPLTVAELMHRTCEANGWEPVRWDPDHPREQPPADRRIRNARLRSLGYSLRHPQIQLPVLRRLDEALFSTVADRARQSPRLRRNHNLHGEADPVQRFLNVLQPGTYVRPHRHRRERPGAGFECFVVLQGAVGLLLLDERGEVIHQERLAAGGPVSGIDLAEDQIHTLVALEPDTVMFEIKEGPYRPASDKDFLTAFPAEGTAAAASLEAAWRERFAEA